MLEGVSVVGEASRQWCFRIEERLGGNLLPPGDADPRCSVAKPTSVPGLLQRVRVSCPRGYIRRITIFNDMADLKFDTDDEYDYWKDDDDGIYGDYGDDSDFVFRCSNLYFKLIVIHFFRATTCRIKFFQ